MFYCGWFAEPLFFGDYPQVMREQCKDLPYFTVNLGVAMLHTC
jgi:hypothetical protein